MAKELRFPRLNAVTLSCRVTRDVELRYTPKGTPIATIPVAFDRSYQDGTGEWQRDSCFLDVVAWNKVAEQNAAFLHKGTAMIVEGYLQVRSYQNKDGANVRVTEIVASRLHMLEREEGDRRVDNRYEGYEPSAPSRSSEPAPVPVTDDDVPF